MEREKEREKRRRKERREFDSNTKWAAVPSMNSEKLGEENQENGGKRNPNLVVECWKRGWLIIFVVMNQFLGLSGIDGGGCLESGGS